jgi:hypothetical protein
MTLVSSLLAVGCDSESPAPPAGPTPADSYFESLQISVADNGQPLIQPGQSRQFIATGRFADGSSFDYTAQAAWDSSDPKVATVSAGGLVTGVADGRVTIRGTYGEKSGSLTTEIARCRLRVTPEAASFDAFGGKTDIQVMSNYASCEWKVMSDTPWLRVSAQPRTGNALFLLEIPENSTPMPRTALIQFGPAEAAPGSAVRITQERPVSCSYVTEPEQTTVRHCYEKNHNSFVVVPEPPNCRWTVTAPSWMTVYVDPSPIPGRPGARWVSYYTNNDWYVTQPREGIILVSGLSGQNPAGRHRVFVGPLSDCYAAAPESFTNRP